MGEGSQKIKKQKGKETSGTECERNASGKYYAILSLKLASKKLISEFADH